MGFENIILEIKEHIAVITLNRPKVMNALNEDLVAELDKAVDKIAGNDEVRAVIITGGEKNFAAGADISKMVEGNPQWAKSFSFKDTFNKIENLQKPTIAAVSGYALGGGLELALVCDLRIVTEGAKLGLPEINLGIFPGAGGTQRLPRLIGSTRAKEMIYLGSIIDAQTALSYGLVNQVVKEENLLEEAMKIARKLAAKPPVALRTAKQVIQDGLSMDLRSGIEYEAVVWASLFATEDQKEGMRAFQEKRKPNFKGK